MVAVYMIILCLLKNDKVRYVQPVFARRSYFLFVALCHCKEGACVTLHAVVSSLQKFLRVTWGKKAPISASLFSFPFLETIFYFHRGFVSVGMFSLCPGFDHFVYTFCKWENDQGIMTFSPISKRSDFPLYCLFYHEIRRGIILKVQFAIFISLVKSWLPL